MATPVTWTEERSKVLVELKKLEPDDRLGMYSAIVKMNMVLFESVKGWDSWLRNPTFMEGFSAEELKEIYANFRDICTRFLEEDIKWTGKKERSTIKLPRAENPETERRYT